MSRGVYVLRTVDGLYYVCYGQVEVIKEKAIKRAERLQKRLTKRRNG